MNNEAHKNSVVNCIQVGHNQCQNYGIEWKTPVVVATLHAPPKLTFYKQTKEHNKP